MTATIGRPVATTTADEDPCPLGPALDVLFPRWTTHVLWALSRRGRLRFSELRGEIPRVTAKVLTERLRQLERDGLVTRTQHKGVPPRVEYENTPLAATLSPIFVTLEKWSATHATEILGSRNRFDAALRAADSDAHLDERLRERG